MAEQDIVERLREVNITRYDEAGEGHVGPCMVEHKNGDYVQHSDHLAVVDKLTAELASLRQQLAEARETNRKLHRRCQQGERVEQMTVDYLGLWLRLLKVKSRDSALFRYVLRKLIARANHIRALSHPDREGERE